MASTIKLKNGTSGAPSSLSGGEVAMNRTTGIFYFGDGSNVQELHRFNNISASGHITASGAISASGTIYAFGFDAAEGNINNVGTLRTDTIRSNTSTAVGLTIVPNITSSGNISSSGNIIANNYFMRDHIAIAETSNKIAFGFENNTSIQIGKNNNPITLTGNVTASGNISSSGNIIASTFVGNIDAVDGDFDGTLEADAITIGGTNIDSKYVPINGAETAIQTTFEAANGTVGTATTATTATNVTAVATGDDAAFFVGVLDGASGAQVVETTTKVKVNPSTGVMITGDTTLGSGILTTNITASGDISSSGYIIANNYVDVKTSGTGYKLSGAKIVYNHNSAYNFGRGPSATRITGSTISLGSPGDIAHVTSSGNISASGNITAPSYTGQVMALDRLNYYITINSDTNYFLGRSVGVEGGDFDVIPTSPFEINDEQVFSANILPVSMSTVGLRSGVRVSGGGTCQIWITTGSRSDWPTAATVPLGFGASGSVTLGNGQDFGTLDIPEFSINDNCDAVYIFVRSEDGDDPTIRITGQLYGRTR